LYNQTRKEVNLEKQARLQVGIDIGRSKADYALLDANGQVVERHHSYENSLTGYLKSKQMLQEAMREGGFTGVDIAVEATGYYWLPLYMQYAQDADLAAYEPRLALLNAGWVKWYKQSFPPDHKSDQRDPYYIAERMRTLPNPTWWDFDPHWLALRLQTRLRLHLARSLSREKNHYQMFLFLAHSDYTRVKPFSDSFGVLSQTLLNDADLLQELETLAVDDLAKRLHELSQHHLKDPLATAENLYKALHASYPLPSDLAPAVQDALQSLGAVVQGLQEQIRFFDERIAALVQTGYPEVAWLDSIPGIGPVFASGIAAEIGGLERFADVKRWDDQRKCYRQRSSREVEDAVAKFAGLWWPEHSSGQFSAEDRPMSKRGNAYLRDYLFLAADRMRLSIPSYNFFYQRKYDQATRHPYKRALVLTARKALGLVVGLLHHCESYKPEEV
jgi:hypothetical protein